MAMNLGDLYSYIDYLTNKDEFGKQLTLENYKVLLTVVNSRYFVEQFNKILPALSVSGGAEMLKAFNNSPLYRFLNSSPLTVTSGVAVLPPTLGRTINGTALVNLGWKYAEFVSAEEADKKKYNIFTPDLAEKPIFIQTPSGYQFIPSSITSASVNFLRKVLDPYFDYCLDADDKIRYMPVGSQITTANVLQDGSGSIIAANVKHVNSPALPYTSVSAEFDWDEVDKVTLSNRIIELVIMKNGQGVQQKKQQPAQQIGG